MSVPTATLPPILPNRGSAKIKSVLSGDTVVLLGRGGDGKRAPEVTFTFERVTAPRCVMLELIVSVMCLDVACISMMCSCS